MNILDNQRKNQILGSFKEVNKSYTEGIYADTPANRKLGRVGMSYTAYADKVQGSDLSKKEIVNLKDSIYTKTQKLTSKLYSDDYWQGVKDIKDAITDSFKDSNLKDLKLEVSVENGGYRQKDDNHWKEYKIKVLSGEKELINGILNCHAAGSMKDPFNRYDMSLVLDTPNISDEDTYKIRENRKKEIKKHLKKSWKDKHLGEWELDTAYGGGQILETKGKNGVKEYEISIWDKEYQNKTVKNNYRFYKTLDEAKTAIEREIIELNF